MVARTGVILDEGVWTERSDNTKNRSARTRRLIDAMSEDHRDDIDNKIFLKQMLEEVYPEYYTEVEMLILSISNYTHREISEVLNISRLGVTKRIAKARELLKEKIVEMLGDDLI